MKRKRKKLKRFSRKKEVERPVEEPKASLYDKQSVLMYRIAFSAFILICVLYGVARCTGFPGKGEQIESSGIVVDKKRYVQYEQRDYKPGHTLTVEFDNGKTRTFNVPEGVFNSYEKDSRVKVVYYERTKQIAEIWTE